MHTTSLEVSKRLFEVSGGQKTLDSWHKTEKAWAMVAIEHNPPSKPVWDYRVVNNNFQALCDYIPAYDSGYLLRKLPIRINGGKWSFMMWKQWHNGKQCNWYTVSYVHINSSLANSPAEARHKVHTCEADTPEDALALLAISLFEEGVLK